MRAWDRIGSWDRRVSRRVGLRFDDPDKSPEQNIALAQRRRRFWLRPPIVVALDEYLTTDAAADALRRRGHRPNVNLLVARGILQPCFVADGRQGVTATSVASELEWRATASRWRKFTRAIGGVLHFV